MPHVSKDKLLKGTHEVLNQEFVSILRDIGSKTRTKITGELLTKTERLMIAKRIGIILFLEKGFSIYKISSLLKVSPSTVARFKTSLEMGKYPELKKWAYLHTPRGKFMKLLEKLVALGLTGKTHSFKKFVDEL